jgi:hypothetical protein
VAVLKYYNTATSAWEYIAASTTANFTSWKKTMAGGETSVSGTDDNAVTLSYTVGLEQVFINGVLQVRGTDYVATTGTSVTGLSTLAVNDVVTVVCYAPFNVANTIAPTVVDAKGDLLAGTAADTVGRLAVGVDTAFLRPDSTASTGLKWDNDAWTSFTPTWTNLTIGNGTNNFKYKQIGKTVFVKGTFTFGSTSTMSTGPTFTLPVTASGTTPNINGILSLGDNSAANSYGGYTRPGSTTTIDVRYHNVSGTLISITGSITSTAPFTWAVNDVIQVYFYYEAE